MKKILLALTFFLTLATVAEAKNVRVFLIVTEGSATADEAYNLFQDAAKIYAKEFKNKKMILHGMGTMPHKAKTLENYQGLVYTMGIYIEDLYPVCKKKNVVCHVLDRPITDSTGKTYLAGFSNLCEAHKKGMHKMPSWSVYSNFNSVGEPRYDHSVIAFAHEIGHMIGAQHLSQAENIMHPYVMNFVEFTGQDLGFLSGSIKQINKCTENTYGTASVSVGDSHDIIFN